LLALRHRYLVRRLPGTGTLAAGAVGDTGVLARWRLGDGAELILASNLGPQPLAIDAVDGTKLFASHDGDAYAVREGRLPAHSTVAFLLESA
jgi:hypothetical protein